MNKIFVIHEYGAESHYIGLQEFCNERRVSLEFYEFRPLYQLLKSIYKKDFKLFLRSINNFFFLLKLFVGLEKKSLFVIGMAPYDWRVIYLNFLLGRRKYYLHTSWPFWNSLYTPKKVKFSLVWRNWELFVSKLSGVFAVTESVKLSFLDKYPEFKPENISVVYHSIDNIIFDLAKNFFSKEKKEKKEIRILYVGRIEKAKGLDLICKLIRRYSNQNVIFDLVGDGDFKVFPSKNLNLHGYISDKKEIANLMLKSDILILPSRKTDNWQELFGMVIIEGMCCGVFPIVTDHIGPKEILHKYQESLVDFDNLEKDFPIKFDSYIEKIHNKLQVSPEKLHQDALSYRSQNISELWGKIL